MNPALADSGQAFDARQVVVAIEPRLLSIAVAADVYGISETTLRALIADDGFPTVRIGRRVLIPVAQADRWIEQVAA
jgi:excisionase family DNA binding protein